MRCKYCGEEIKEEYLYCLFCGKPSAKSKVEHKVEQERKKRQETSSFEYFEIEKRANKNQEEYDFSQFLYDDENEGINVSTKEKETKDKENIESTNRHEFDIDDDLEDTKEQKFGRSDFKIYDEFRKNKGNSQEKIKKKTKVKQEKKKKIETEDIKKQYISEEEKKVQKLKRRSRFWKRFRNFIYNILAAVGIWFLYLLVKYPLIDLLGDFIVGDVIYNNIQFAELAILLIMIFLFIPFFICKGNAKVPLFFFCILVSWTIIGWIILIVVAISSNIKFKRVY